MLKNLWSKERSRVRHKPGSVLENLQADCSRAVIYLDNELPHASSGTLLSEPNNLEQAKNQPSLRRPCTQPGFTEPVPHETAGALLPHLCTLTRGIENFQSFISPGGIFLWHYPHDRSHWALPSKFGFWGARTFLRRCKHLPQLPSLTLLRLLV